MSFAQQEQLALSVLHDIWSNTSPSLYSVPSFTLSLQDLNHVLNNKFSFFSGNIQGDLLERVGNVFLRQGRDITLDDLYNLCTLGHPIVAIGQKDLTSDELCLINLRVGQTTTDTLITIWNSLKGAPYIVYHMPLSESISEEYYDSDNVCHWEELLVEQRWLPEGFVDSLELSVGQKRLVIELLLNYTSITKHNASRNWDYLVRISNAVTCIFGVLSGSGDNDVEFTRTLSPFARLLENVCNNNRVVASSNSKSIAVHCDSTSTAYLYTVDVQPLNLSLEIGPAGLVCTMVPWGEEEEKECEAEDYQFGDTGENCDSDNNAVVSCWESMQIEESSLEGSPMGHLLVSTVGNSVMEFRIGASLHLIVHFEYYGVSPQKILESGIERWGLGHQNLGNGGNNHVSSKHDGAYIDVRDVDKDDGYWRRLMRNYSLKGIGDILPLGDWLAWVDTLSSNNGGDVDDDEWSDCSYDEGNDTGNGYTEGGYKDYVGQGSGHLFHHLHTDYTAEYEQMNSPSLLLLSCCDSTTFRRNDVFIFDVKLLLCKICPGLLASLSPSPSAYIKYLADITLGWWMDFNDWTSVRNTKWRVGECGEYYVNAETGGLIFSLPPTHNNSEYMRGNEGDIVFDARLDEFGHYVINYAPHDFAERDTPILTSFGYLEQQKSHQQTQVTTTLIILPDWIKRMVAIALCTFGVSEGCERPIYWEPLQSELWVKVFAPRLVVPINDSECEGIEAQNITSLLKHPETTHPLLALEIVKYIVENGAGGVVDIVSSYWPNVPNRLVKLFTRDHWRRGQYLFDYALLCINVRTHVRASNGGVLKPAKYLLVAITTKTFDDKRTGLYPDYFSIWALFDSSKDPFGSGDNNIARSISLNKLETHILPYAQACTRMR